MRARPRVDEPEGPSTAPCRRLAPATPWLPLQVCSNWKSNQSNQQPPEPTKRPTKSLIASDPFAETERALGTNRGDPADTAAKNEKEFEEERGGSKTYRGRKGRSLDEEADLFLVASCELEVDLRGGVGAGAADLARGMGEACRCGIWSRH
jgi:hypothetical protein